MVAQRPRPALLGAFARRSKIRARRQVWLLPMLAGGLLAIAAPRAHAQQLIVPTPDIVRPPWNSQRVFDPWPLPELTDPSAREPVATEDKPIKERVYPEYQARGIRSGSWMFYPSLRAGTLYDSNVFSSATNAQADFAARFGAGLHAQSLWERHGIDLQLMTDSLVYRNHSGLNQTDVSFRGTGKLDIDSTTQLLATLQAAYLHIEVGSLTSPTGAVEPTPYGFLSSDITLRKEFGRVTTSLGTRVDSYDFGSTRAQNGSIINQDSRDGQIYTAYGRVDYAFSDKSAIFTSLEGNQRNLRGSPGTPLDSEGYRSLTGFDIALTNLVRGEVAAGYQRQHFFANSIGNVEGPAYRAFLTWTPSRRVDVFFNAEQVVTEISDTSTTGVLARAAQLGVDYELRPNVVLSSALTYEKDLFKGQPREDNVYVAETGLKYLANNVLSIALKYRYSRRDSNIPVNSYDKHQISITASTRF